MKTPRTGSRARRCVRVGGQEPDPRVGLRRQGRAGSPRPGRRVRGWGGEGGSRLAWPGGSFDPQPADDPSHSGKHGRCPAPPRCASEPASETDALTNQLELCLRCVQTYFLMGSIGNCYVPCAGAAASIPSVSPIRPHSEAASRAGMPLRGHTRPHAGSRRAGAPGVPQNRTRRSAGSHEPAPARAEKLLPNETQCKKASHAPCRGLGDRDDRRAAL